MTIADPRHWGASFWFVMHAVAEAYPNQPTVEDILDATCFYTSLKSLLPCPACAAHYTQLLQEHPLEEAVKSRYALMQWVNTVHNKVNLKLNKPHVSMDQYRLKTLETPPPAAHAPPGKSLVGGRLLPGALAALLLGAGLVAATVVLRKKPLSRSRR